MIIVIFTIIVMIVMILKLHMVIHITMAQNGFGYMDILLKDYIY